MPRKLTGPSASYTTDLTRLAREGKLDPIVGRDYEIRRVMQTLTRRSKNNPVLIGDAGVGKTAIVEGLAQMLVSEGVPEMLANKRVFGAEHRSAYRRCEVPRRIRKSG